MILLRLRSVLPLAALVAASLLLPGCNQNQGSEPPPKNTVTIARPQSGNNEIGLKTEQVPVEPGKATVETALNKLFATADEGDKTAAIPKGTKLIDVKVVDGIARINVSKEWNELKHHGSTEESLAENALRATLAQFPEVQKMLLVVEGKVFESEHADWSEPIPVRESKTASEGAP